MKKYAGLEETEITDPKTSKDIAVSTTARIMFRKAWPDQYAQMRNVRLNIEIAKDFASNSGNVVHYFWMNKEKRIIAEIRKGSSSFFYISVVRGKRIDVLAIQSSWLKPKFRSSSQVIELGDGEDE